MFLYLLFNLYVTVLRIHVKEIGVMGPLGAIPDALTADDGPKAILQCINCRRSHTPTGGCPSNNHGINALPMKITIQLGPKKCTRIFLNDDLIPFYRSNSPIDLYPLRAFNEQRQCGNFLYKYARIIKVWLISYGGIDHRKTSCPELRQ